MLALPLKPPHAPSPDGAAGLPSSRCSGGWCPLERGPLGRCAVVQAAGHGGSCGACHPAQGLSECGGAAPLRSGGWGFFAAAGGSGSGFWMARRPARGCGGRGRLGPGVGGRWVAGVPRCGRVLLDAWLGPSLSPVNLEPCCSSRWPRLMPSRRPDGRRFYPAPLLPNSAKSPHCKRFGLANSAPVLVQ